MEERFTALLNFKEKYGHYNVPLNHPILGTWVDEQKKVAKKFALEDDATVYFDAKIKELLSLGFRIDVVEEGNCHGRSGGDNGGNGGGSIHEDTNVNRNKNGDCKIGSDIGIGISISNSSSQNGKREKSESKMTFSTGSTNNGSTSGGSGGSSGGNNRPSDDKRWMKFFNELVEYKQKIGNCEVPPSQHTPLAYWVVQQHKEYQKVQDGKPSRLTLQKVQQLTDIGFVFRQVSKSCTWEERIEQLKQYRQKNGHVRVPKSDPQLGVFVNRQRYEYSKYKSGRQSTMNETRLQDLESLDFIFVAGKKMDHVDFKKKKSWEQRFDELLQFRDTYGHVIVPQSFPGLG